MQRSERLDAGREGPRSGLEARIERRILDRYVETCAPDAALAFADAEETYRSLMRRARVRRLGVAVARVPVVGAVVRRIWRGVERARRGGAPA